VVAFPFRIFGVRNEKRVGKRRETVKKFQKKGSLLTPTWWRRRDNSPATASDSFPTTVSPTGEDEDERREKRTSLSRNKVERERQEGNERKRVLHPLNTPSNREVLQDPTQGLNRTGPQPVL